MRFSVVINTYNRAESLKVTLDALKHQTHDDFEVVVVNGPSTDSTADLLRERPEVRAVDCPERNLAVSRNLGIDAAAGEVVAFIDDDAVPEPSWLADLERSYVDSQVGGVGGLVLDRTGTEPQFRYSVCSRVGDTNFDEKPPLDAFNVPGADPFLYLQGTNCSFRRDVLERVGGFDEEIEYNYDESELASQIIDAGWRLETRPDAAVHHKVLASHMRTDRAFVDPYVQIKNRVYFSIRVGLAAGRPMSDIVASLGRNVDHLKAGAAAAAALGEATTEEAEFYVRRLDEGFAVGFERGLRGERKGRPIHPAPTGDFRRYPTLRAAGRRLVMCFVTLDYEPRPVGGIARFTGDLARGFAAAGHEVHVVTRAGEGPYHIEFENGVWVHRFPVADRWLPPLSDCVSKGNLEHLAAVHAVVDRIDQRSPVDIVIGSLWAAEPLLCAYDPRWVTVVYFTTPMRTVAAAQPHTAQQPHTEGQIRLEEATLRSGAHLQLVSRANAAVARDIAEVPEAVTSVMPHGLVDKQSDFKRTRDDDAVEVLFVGRLEPRKGVDTLLEASVDILRERQNVRVRLIGSDNPEANGAPEHFQTWVRTHASDVADRVLFEGYVEDAAMYQALANADIFCGPSRYESFGLVHIEAMMMSLPVIGCRSGGMEETIIDGETGFLVPPGDVTALREALVRLIEDPDLRHSFGHAGRTRFEEQFELSVAVARCEEVYTSLVDRTPRREDDVAAAELLERTTDVVAAVCHTTRADAEEVAAVLLDRSRFPVDDEARVRSALALPDSQFVDAMYEIVLRRLPDEAGRRYYESGLAAGRTRIELISEFVDGPEARRSQFAEELVANLPVLDSSELIEPLQRVWYAQDDEQFVRELHGCLRGEVVETDVHEDVQRLRSGARREEILATLTRRISVQRRLLAPERLRSKSFRTAEEVVAAVAAAASSEGTAEFVAALYTELLGRDPDPPGLAVYSTMAEEDGRDAVVAHLAASREARAAGIRDTVVPLLVAAAARAAHAGERAPASNKRSNKRSFLGAVGSALSAARGRR